MKRDGIAGHNPSCAEICGTQNCECSPIINLGRRSNQAYRDGFNVSATIWNNLHGCWCDNSDLRTDAADNVPVSIYEFIVSIVESNSNSHKLARAYIWIVIVRDARIEGNMITG